MLWHKTFIDGSSVKLINNDGLICVEEASELSTKVETFSYYTYRSQTPSLIVFDIQRVDYTLCDPEIASTTHVHEPNNYYFCTGIWSTKGMETFFFFNKHKCNIYCNLLNLKYFIPKCCLSQYYTRCSVPLCYKDNKIPISCIQILLQQSGGYVTLSSYVTLRYVTLSFYIIMSLLYQQFSLY